MTLSSLELKSSIELLQANKVTSMKTMVDLGCDFYMKAKVYEFFFHHSITSLNLNRPDISKIFVLVGLGFHVEFTLPEALAFVDKKEQILSKYEHDLEISVKFTI